MGGCDVEGLSTSREILLAAPRGEKPKEAEWAMNPMRSCRMHGGASTGPVTVEGLKRSIRARWIHGGRSREVRELLATNRRRWRELRALLD